MQKTIMKKLYKEMLQVPGFMGLVQNNLLKAPKVLNDDNYEEGFQEIEVNKTKVLKVSIAISSSVRATVVTSEVNQIIKKVLKENNVSIRKIYIYIRGVL